MALSRKSFKWCVIMINLSPRLRAVADYIPSGSRVVDVGTDHARLPVWLMQNGFNSVTATDISTGPLEKAKALIAKLGFEDRIKLIQTDGLSGISLEDVDVITISGLGGENIVDVLIKAPHIAGRTLRLVLSPTTSANELRAYLLENGFAFAGERLCADAGRLHEIICVQTPLAHDSHANPVHAAWHYSGMLLKGDPLYTLHLDRLIARFSKAERGALQSGKTCDALKAKEFRDILEELGRLRNGDC